MSHLFQVISSCLRCSDKSYLVQGLSNSCMCKHIQIALKLCVLFQNTVNTKAVLFSASDKDGLGELTFTIEDQDGQKNLSGKFEMVRIDGSSSWLSITNLDFEDQSLYQLKVIVRVTIFNHKEHLSQGAASLTITAKASLERHQIFNIIKRHGPCHQSLSMTIFIIVIIIFIFSIILTFKMSSQYMIRLKSKKNDGKMMKNHHFQINGNS